MAYKSNYEADEDEATDLDDQDRVQARDESAPLNEPSDSGEEPNLGVEPAENIPSDLEPAQSPAEFNDDLEAQEESLKPEESKEEPEVKREIASKKEEKKSENDEGDLDNEEQETQPLSPQQAQLNKYQDFIKQYQDLQNKQRGADLMVGLNAAANKFGQSAAGRISGNVVPDMAGNQMLAAQAARPLQQFPQQAQAFQLQALAEENNPNSNISQAYRSYFAQRILPKDAKGQPDKSTFPNFDQYSAADLQNLLKNIGKPTIDKGQVKAGYYIDDQGKKHDVTVIFSPAKQAFVDADTGQVVKGFHEAPLNQYGYMKDAHGNIIKKDLGLGTISSTPVVSSAYKPVEQMTPKEQENFRPDQTQQKAIEVEQRRMDTMTKAAHDGITAANNLETQLSKPGAFQGAVLKTTLPRMMGFNGRMSPLEQNMWQGSQALKDRLAQLAQTYGEGTLTEKNKAEALAVVQDFRRNIQNDLNRIGQNSQQSLAMTYSIPSSFSSKAIKLPKAQSGGTDPQIQKFADDHYGGDYGQAKANILLRNPNYQEQQ